MNKISALSIQAKVHKNRLSWVIVMWHRFGSVIYGICFDFRSTNVAPLGNRNPYFYWFQCHHPLINQLRTDHWSWMISKKNSFSRNYSQKYYTLFLSDLYSTDTTFCIIIWGRVPSWRNKFDWDFAKWLISKLVKNLAHINSLIFDNLSIYGKFHF